MRNSIFIFTFISFIWPKLLLIPMDKVQENHLKAYGLTFMGLKANLKCKWLLNYRGGSFLIPYLDSLQDIVQNKAITGRIAMKI